MSHAILIPSSRYVSEGMRLEVGNIPPVLISVRGKTVLQMIADQRDERSPKAPIYLIVNQGKEQVWEYLYRNPIEELYLIEVPELPDLGKTIEYALGKIPLDRDSELLINFGDTVVEPFNPPSGNEVFYETCHESYLWTSFTQRAGQIAKIIDRFTLESLAPHDVFVGLFSIAKPIQFLSEIKKAKADKKNRISKFYVALKRYYQRQGDYRLIRTKKWLDFGHVENFHRARKQSSIARNFNSLAFNEHRPTVVKTSTKTTKLRDEINWYLKVPQQFKCFVPQIIDYNLKNPKVELEYYGYPTIAELYVSAGHGLEIWWPVITAVKSVLLEMRRYKADYNAAQRRSILTEMYVNKTVERVKQLEQHPVLGSAVTEPLTVNGKRLPALRDFLEVLPQLCAASGLLKSKPFTLIHGDFCFSNILFDTRMRLPKLIDPRGSFGKAGIYGDSRYDLAKLLHSFDGKYDLIKSNQFFALLNKQRLNYSVYSKPIHNTASKFFRESLMADFGSELEEAALIEALLFASLIPLHEESLQQQIAFLGIALTKLNQQCIKYQIELPSSVSTEARRSPTRNRIVPTKIRGSDILR